MSVINERDWNTLDWTGWADLRENLFECDSATTPGFTLENFLPANVPRPEGAIVGHAWFKEGDYVEHWITQDNDDLYFRYRADDVAMCGNAVTASEPPAGCSIVTTAYSSGTGTQYTSLEAALA